MSGTKNLSQLGQLVAFHHGWQAAKAFKAYQMDDADRAKLSFSALEILKVFPHLENASALMSAAFAVHLERALDAPIQVVAGILKVEKDVLFGKRTKAPIRAFPSATADYDGHIWLMVGPYIADISIFRTAYSRHGPAKLSRHIDLVFGPNKGLYVDHWKRTRQMGLGYEPHYVLSAAEVTNLMGGAFQKIQDEQRKDITAN